MNTSITRTLTLIAAILTIGQVFSAEPVRLKKNSMKSGLERSLDKALSKHLAYPVMAKGDMTGEVFVSFVIDKEGKIEVLDCRSANDSLKEYVLRKLERIDVGDNSDGIWKTTHMRISFAPERT